MHGFRLKGLQKSTTHYPTDAERHVSTSPTRPRKPAILAPVRHEAPCVIGGLYCFVLASKPHTENPARKEAIDALFLTDNGSAASSALHAYGTASCRSSIPHACYTRPTCAIPESFLVFLAFELSLPSPVCASRARSVVLSFVALSNLSSTVCGFSYLDF
jgi:hypothetical protein